MIRDRLQDLHTTAGLPVETSINLDYDDNKGGAPQDKVAQGIDHTEIFKLLDILGPLYYDIKSLHGQISGLRAGLYEHNNAHFDDKVAAVKKQAMTIRRGIEKVKQDYSSPSNHLVGHMAHTHYLSLYVWSSIALTDLSTLLVEARERHRQYLRKEIMITSGLDKNMTEEELESLLSGDTPSEAVFTQDLLMETKAAKQTLTAIRARHDQVLRLEGSIVELSTMFQDLAVLVRGQGETLDRIEQHMYEAKELTEKAREQVAEARVKAQSYRKRKLIMILVLVALVVLFVGLFAYSFTE